MPKSVLFDREKVIDDVTNLFWEKGYNGTSMQDLVDVTGLNRSSLYNTFGDKFSLFQESLKSYQKKQSDSLDQLIKESGSPMKAIEALFMLAVKDQKLGTAKKGCFMSNCTSELSNVNDQVKNLVTDNKDHMLITLESLLSKAKQDEELSSEDDVNELALYLFSSLQGIRITAMIEGDIKAVIKHTLKKL